MNTPLTGAELRATMARRFVTLQKGLAHRFRAGIPAEVREELSQITHHQLDAMSVIGRGPVTMTELAAAMGSTSMSSMTQLADRLVKTGLVERLTDENDRRVVRLALTDSARRVVESYMDAGRAAVMSAFERLSDDEVVQFMTLLERLAGDAGNCAGDRGGDTDAR